MAKIRYCTEYRDTIRFQNALTYLTAPMLYTQPCVKCNRFIIHRRQVGNLAVTAFTITIACSLSPDDVDAWLSISRNTCGCVLPWCFALLCSYWRFTFTHHVNGIVVIWSWVHCPWERLRPALWSIDSIRFRSQFSYRRQTALTMPEPPGAFVRSTVAAAPCRRCRRATYVGLSGSPRSRRCQPLSFKPQSAAKQTTSQRSRR